MNTNPSPESTTPPLPTPDEVANLLEALKRRGHTYTAEVVSNLWTHAERAGQERFDSIYEAALRYGEKEQELRRAEAENTTVKEEVERLREDSRRLMTDWLTDGASEREYHAHIIDHDCDFAHRPDMAGCTFHEEWFAMAERNGCMEDFALHDSECLETEFHGEKNAAALGEEAPTDA